MKLLKSLAALFMGLANPTAAINRRVEIRRVSVLTGSVNAAPVLGGRLVATPQ